MSLPQHVSSNDINMNDVNVTKNPHLQLLVASPVTDITGTNAKAPTHDAWVLKLYTVILCHIWCQEIAFCFGNFNAGNSKKAHETTFCPGLSAFSTRVGQSLAL